MSFSDLKVTQFAGRITEDELRSAIQEFQEEKSRRNVRRLFHRVRGMVLFFRSQNTDEQTIAKIVAFVMQGCELVNPESETIVRDVVELVFEPIQ